MVALLKTRIIPIGDFYTRLQVEYICYKFRSMIYQRPFDKKKFIDICEKKKVKIDQISLENCLPSIFNNVDQQKKYFTRFFNSSGPPNFCYRDDYQKKVKGHWDKFYYFVVGASVKLQLNGEIEIGYVVTCDLDKEIITVDILEMEKKVKFCDATRIFPSDFYSKFFE